jgi:hypothetical protein
VRTGQPTTMPPGNASGQHCVAIYAMAIGESTGQPTTMPPGNASGQHCGAFFPLTFGERTRQPSSIERVIKLRTSCGLRQKEAFVSSNFMLD